MPPPTDLSRVLVLHERRGARWKTPLYPTLSIPSRSPSGGHELAENYPREEGVWLITYKKATGLPTIEYDESVEEALCFGWVDSKAGTLDDKRSMLWFAPRKPTSGWSKSNKERVERLIAQGRMAPPGLAKVQTAKANGTWNAPRALWSGWKFLLDLAAALTATPDAAAYFDDFPAPSSGASWSGLQAPKRPRPAGAVSETAVAGRRKHPGQPMAEVRVTSRPPTQTHHALCCRPSGSPWQRPEACCQPLVEALHALDGRIVTIRIGDRAFSYDIIGENHRARPGELERPVEVLDVTRLVCIDEDQIEGLLPSAASCASTLSAQPSRSSITSVRPALREVFAPPQRAWARPRC